MNLRNSLISSVMKKIFSIITFLLLVIVNVFSQAPKRVSYQAVVRDHDNKLITNSMVGVRISILQFQPIGTPVYAEIHTETTNINGLVTLEIGNGLTDLGDFDAIDWALGPYFIKIETDPTGGTNYSISGIQQLLSVPYSLYAETSGSSLPGPAGPMGPAGANGVIGRDGINGANGLNGRDGRDGQTGATGPQGPIGLIGATGPQGSQGNDGIDGVDGATGAVGPIGFTGATGPQGNNGVDGAQGPIGLTGAIGPQGPQGNDGIDGVDGATGLQGPIGLTGAIGPQGNDGIDGIPGYSGGNGGYLIGIGNNF